MTPRPVTLSVILPCFRAAPVAAETVSELESVLETSFPGEWEIIVVDDGGEDFPPDWPPGNAVSLIEMDRNHGKGRAIRTGMARARGRARIYTDIDLPYDPWLIPVMAQYLLTDDFHLVVGDRRLPESSYQVDLPLPRRFVSSVSTFLIGTLVTGGFFDTQCGLKGLRGDVADLIFPMVQTDRFVFDVEVVYLSLRFNCNIKRLPVSPGRGQQRSTVRPFRDSVRGLTDLLRIKARALRGGYGCEPLRALVNARFESRLSEVRPGVEGT
jgi:dolichyl-phosphate beta-glucosyltransferase